MLLPWPARYIGKPWVAGGRGPLEFDCWGLVVDVYRTELGIELEQLAGIDPKKKLEVARALRVKHGGEQFEQVSDRQDFDVVLMGRGGPCHHVGLWVASERGILHCQDGAGVVLCPNSQLRARGFTNNEFYRHASMLLHQKPV